MSRSAADYPEALRQRTEAWRKLAGTSRSAADRPQPLHLGPAAWRKPASTPRSAADPQQAPRLIGGIVLALVAIAVIVPLVASRPQTPPGPGAATRSPVGSPTPTGTPTPNPAAQIPGWTLIWWDEFDGPSLDTTKWSVVSDAPGGYQHCCLADTLNAWASDDVSLVGGSLRLTTERRSFQGHAYTSGAVTTKGKFDFLYGRVDMRARLPRGNGLWPAFWLLPSDFAGSGYAPFEVDVAEALGQRPRTDYMFAWVGTQRTGYCWYSGPDFTADYHVFSYLWTTTSISWLIDGTQRCKFTQGMPTVPMELILNTRIGGSWPVPPDASTALPQYTDIDYVRVYTAAK